ncbi:MULTISPECIES: HTH-type transcriptional regulator ArgP [Burkholderia]|uniref:HTH-type transcriptional regulator ArgP n=1 Tax=Burkholderia sola TaxID=2843302 RepID=A0ABV2C911_9BURK|nr:HTH-type transcriptional regulator ArgP [Burkholderia sp. CpTa8-5]MBP0607655.1 HTH-type transcriptional regulator ArgP [Burkholderia sp. CpTa8-5]
MFDRNQLEAFAAVVEHRSFEQAASALHLTRGAVSQRIKALEETLSTVLLIRNRPVLPTPAGEVMLRHVKALRLLEHDVHARLSGGLSVQERTPVTVGINADSLATWFADCANTLLAELPIALEIVVDDQDHTRPMLLRGEVTGCVCTEPTPAQGFQAAPLGMMEYRCVATRAFASRHFPNGLTPHEVPTAPAVLFNRKDSLHDDFLGMLFGVQLKQYVRHYFPSPVALLGAIAQGSGYGLVPLVQIQSHPIHEQLVDLAPHRGLSVPLYWHHWDQEPTLARQLTERVVAFARTALASTPQPPASPPIASAVPRESA